LQASISGRRGAVIVGTAGVGKTVLATLGVEFARHLKMSVALVARTEAARPYSFGAFAALLHRDSDLVGPESHADQLRRYMHELLDDAGQRPLLVFVDDAHRFDDGSASLVHQLVQTGAATVIACVLPLARAPGGEPMVALWKDYGAARIELGSLDGQAVEDLLLAVLGGPVDTVSLRQLAERSLGDPHSGRTRHGVAGCDREHRQADRRDDAPFGAHGREPPAPRLPEARLSHRRELAEALRDLPGI
jgi:hypothetical protein